MGNLSVFANHLDISGNIAIDGANDIQFDVDGDIQLKGLYIRDLLDLPFGELAYSGDLTVTANQLYTSTYTRFNITNQDLTDGRFEMLQNGSYEAVLSAASELNIQSPNILNSGVIRAPGGVINLTASNQIDLNSGSVLSTSLEGAVVPFGRTEAGDWVYTVNNNGSTFTFVISKPPVKNISLASNDINFNENAVIDISGSGDLAAYEFIPGPNGTVDILNAELFPESYAISYINDTSYVPFDHAESVEFSADSGSEIILLDGINGLPAGRYGLFPARYALLPNFYLITKQEGYTGITESQTVKLSDGSTLVGGRLAIANTSIVDYQSEGYSIISSSEINNFAQYDRTSANSFFSGSDQSVRPADAGTVSLAALTNLTFLGSLNASAAAGGIGGLVDIQSDNIAVVESVDTEVDEGFLKLIAGSLSSIGSQSLLLGGTRTQTEDGQTQLNVTSETNKDI